MMIECLMTAVKRQATTTIRVGREANKATVDWETTKPMRSSAQCSWWGTYEYSCMAIYLRRERERKKKKVTGLIPTSIYIPVYHLLFCLSVCLSRLWSLQNWNTAQFYYLWPRNFWDVLSRAIDILVRTTTSVLRSDINCLPVYLYLCECGGSQL